VKRKFLPTGILFMLVVVALAAIGVGYGLWYKVLTIDGTVNTGSVNAVFTDAFTDDDDVMNNAAKDPTDLDDCVDIGGVDMDGDTLTSCDPMASGANAPRWDKDVARCDAGIDALDDQIAWVTKTNVYPGYFCTAWFDVENTGTIPVRVASATVNGQPVTPSVPTPFDLNGDTLPDVNIHLTGLDPAGCQQIDPGPENAVQMDIDQEILQDAPMGATLSYTVEVQLNQWNEPCPP